MAQSTCLKCNGHTFELKTSEVRGARYKYNFIQCTGCGGVVGVVEYFNAGVLLKKVMEHFHIRDD